jgi:hypothetical protein
MRDHPPGWVPPLVGQRCGRSSSPGIGQERQAAELGSCRTSSARRRAVANGTSNRRTSPQLKSITLLVSAARIAAP